MARYSRYWENDDIVRELDIGWNSKKDLTKDAVKEFIVKNTSRNTEFLDVGCGTGFFSKTASDICGKKNYLGIDVTKNMIDFCKNKYPNLRFELGNVLNLYNIPSDKYDIVINCDPKLW